MFPPSKSKAEKSGLDTVINDVLAEMKGFTAESEEFAQMADQLTKLYALKAIDKPDRLSKDTLATIGGNLLGIAMIVGFERANIVTSKALNLLLKTR